MNKHQRAALRRFRRVQVFIAQHQAVGGVEELGKQRQTLDDVIEKLVQNGAEQDANFRFTRGEVTRQRALRAELWDNHMVPISKVARLVYSAPELETALLLPKRRADNDRLLDVARGMAQAAAKREQVFVENGLPKDFLERLRAATSALASVLSERVDSERRRKLANEAVRELVKRGTTAVKMLDAVVSPRLARDVDVLAAWKSVKRPIEPGGASSTPSIDEPTAPSMKVA